MPDVVSSKSTILRDEKLVYSDLLKGVEEVLPGYKADLDAAQAAYDDIVARIASYREKLAKIDEELAGLQE